MDRVVHGVQISQALSYVEGLGEGAAMFQEYVATFRMTLEEAAVAAVADDDAEEGAGLSFSLFFAPADMHLIAMCHLRLARCVC